MQLSYRGRRYNPEMSNVSTMQKPFQGQFLGMPAPLTASYHNETPNAVVTLTYRGQRYWGAH